MCPFWKLISRQFIKIGIKQVGWYFFLCFLRSLYLSFKKKKKFKKMGIKLFSGLGGHACSIGPSGTSEGIQSWNPVNNSWGPKTPAATLKTETIGRSMGLWGQKNKMGQIITSLPPPGSCDHFSRFSRGYLGVGDAECQMPWCSAVLCSICSLQVCSLLSNFEKILELFHLCHSQLLWEASPFVLF